MTQTPNFHVRTLVKTYDGRRVLDVDALDFEAGQFVALMGKNGSGKSTLMRLLVQREMPDAGTLTYGGESLTSPDLRLNPEAVFVAEDQELPLGHSIGRWAEIFARHYAAYDRDVYATLVRDFEIDPTKTIYALSRGQKVKALFALEAARRPRVYVLDEITAVLDVGSRLALMDFLGRETARGCVVVMSTNIASELESVATHAVFLEKGRVAFSAARREIGAYFAKIRGRAGRDVPPSLGARKVGYNADGRWSYLCPRAALANQTDADFDVDAREITLAEIQAYFTAGEK